MNAAVRLALSLSAAITMFAGQPERLTISGSVVSDRQRPVVNAVVSIASLGKSVRTDSLGRFAVPGVPSGTFMLSARAIGYTPRDQQISIQAGASANITVLLEVVTALETRNVVGMSATRAEFEDRRARQMGILIDSARLSRPDFVSALANLPLTRVERKGFGAAILLRNLSSRATCQPVTFLNGFPTLMESVTARPPSDFSFVELIPYEQTAGKYGGAVGCGAALFWTKDYKWP